MISEQFGATLHASPSGGAEGDCSVTNACSLDYALSKAADGDAVSLSAGLFPLHKPLELKNNVTVTGPDYGGAPTAVITCQVSIASGQVADQCPMPCTSYSPQANSKDGEYCQYRQGGRCVPTCSDPPCGRAPHCSSQQVHCYQPIAESAAFSAHSGPIKAVLQNLRIEQCAAGAIAASGITVSVSLINSEVTQSGGNATSEWSKHAVVVQSGATMQITQSNFSRNLGGAVYVNQGTVVIVNTQFLSNWAANGAALYVANVSSVTLSGSSLINNSADQGGAIYLQRGSLSTGSSLAIVGSVFQQNEAADRGGALRLECHNYVQVSRSTFSSNRAASMGAAVFATCSSDSNGELLPRFSSPGGVLSFTQCAFDNHSLNSPAFVAAIQWSHNSWNSEKAQVTGSAITEAGYTIVLYNGAIASFHQVNLTANPAGGLAVFDGSNVPGSSIGATMNRVQFTEHVMSLSDQAAGFSPMHGAAMILFGNMSSSCLQCVFIGNVARIGAAVYVTGSASPVFKNSLFSSNQARTHFGEATGSAVYVHGAGMTIFSRCVFQHNRAHVLEVNWLHGSTSSSGGAIKVSSGNANWTLCDFWNNSATLGGAADLQQGDRNMISFWNCTFRANRAIGYNNKRKQLAGAGGALNIVGGGANGIARLTACVFADNSAPSGYGGAVSISASASPQFFHTIFTNNTATNGGAIFVTFVGTKALFKLCTFESNTAAGRTSDGLAVAANGGAISTIGDSYLMVASCTFLDNNCNSSVGGAGEAIFVNSATLLILNSTILSQTQQNPQMKEFDVYLYHANVGAQVSDSRIGSLFVGELSSVSFQAVQTSSLSAVTNQDSDSSAAPGDKGNPLYLRSFCFHCALAVLFPL